MAADPVGAGPTGRRDPAAAPSPAADARTVGAFGRIEDAGRAEARPGREGPGFAVAVGQLAEIAAPIGRHAGRIAQITSVEVFDETQARAIGPGIGAVFVLGNVEHAVSMLHEWGRNDYKPRSPNTAAMPWRRPTKKPVYAAVHRQAAYFPTIISNRPRMLGLRFWSVKA